ncbi:helix-turn-helix domain-containing protein [Cellulomonas citrea]|uniref:helix-turn-helix domain-containing protein n=1 Tax=Cellulomonas citrea TaxID=1909423 RepID=UPI00135AB783|nr:helix-turn-helix transcriptional regulator [Cellulomonas citrea]
MEPTTLVPVQRGSSWRRAIGHVLRQARLDRGLRLADVCARAGLSPQYLSEVERGRKEASSQVLAAVTAALGLSLVELADRVAGQLEGARPRREPAVPTVAREPVPQPLTGPTVLELTGTPSSAGPGSLVSAPVGLSSGVAVLLAA